MYGNKTNTLIVALVCIFLGLLLLILTGIYSNYFYHNFRHHIPPQYPYNNKSIQDWMTIRFISRIDNVPQQQLLNALHMTQTQTQYRSIMAIAYAQHESTTQIISIIQKTIHQFHTNQ